jgi:hypothetical protein
MGGEGSWKKLCKNEAWKKVVQKGNMEGSCV